MKPIQNGAPVSSFAYSLTLKIELICFSETSVEFQRNIRRYISEDETLHSLFCSPFMTILTYDTKGTKLILTRGGPRHNCVNLWMSLWPEPSLSCEQLWKQRWIMVNCRTLYTAWRYIRSGIGGRRLAVQTLYETQYITLWLNAIWARRERQSHNKRKLYVITQQQGFVAGAMTLRGR